MGFYYGAGRLKRASVDFGPVVTPREYIAAFRAATGAVLGGDALPCRDSNAVTSLSSPVFVQALLCRVRRCPADATAHRFLGVALLDAGSARAGVRHLGIALRLLLADVEARTSLYGSLSARLEIGLLCVPLVSVASRAGRPALLRRLLGLLS